MIGSFVADLAAIDGDGKKSEQTDDRLDDIGDTAPNRVLVKKVRDLLKSLGTSVKNLGMVDVVPHLLSPV